MKKVQKGAYGYIRYQKIRRILITLLMFGIPLMIFLTGLYITKGDRKNMFTFVAIMGCLPAAKAAVSMILILMQKPMKAEVYETVKEHVKDMTVLYESTVSSYEKNIALPCIVISGLNVVCYMEDEKIEPSFVENHIKKIIQGNGYRSNVKVFRDLKPFLKRIDEIYPGHIEQEAAIAFRPDDKYPGLTRNEIIRHIIMAISV